MRYEAVVTLISIRRIKKVGRITAYRFYRFLRDERNGEWPSAPYDLYKLLKESGVVSEDKLNMLYIEKVWKDAETIYARSVASNVLLIPIIDSRYPEMLRKINPPPLILYVQGNSDLLNEPSVAVVGTRCPSQISSEVAWDLSKRLAMRGIVIVSGLALGIDTRAHLGALSSEGKGRTVAVLGHGLGKAIYPKENKPLAERILEAGGTLVSEYAPDEWVTKYRLVERDRLQSGLSAAVVVIETSKTGGSMHTARMCVEQKRRLYALSISASGNRKLIEEGIEGHRAIPVKIPVSNEVIEDLCDCAMSFMGETRTTTEIQLKLFS